MEGYIRERKPVIQFPALTLRGVFGRRLFKMQLKNEAGLTTADLSKEVQCQTGVPPDKQKLLYNGMVLDPPDTGAWAPRLDLLALREGDRVHVIAPLAEERPDHHSIIQLTSSGNRLEKLGVEMKGLTTHLDAILHGFKVQTSAVVALTKLRKDFEDMKTKLRKEIQTLSSLTFDYRNCLCQARRRQLVDATQRQIDKCTDVSGAIFQRLSLSHSMSRVGRLYPVERSVRPVR